MQVEVKFSEWIKAGFDLYKQNLATIIVASILAAILSVFTVGVLAGPMTAGLIIVILGLLDGKEPKPDIGDVFKGFNVFVHSFIFCLVVFLAYLLGSVILAAIPPASMLFGYVLSTFVVFSIFLIADQKMEFWPAVQSSVAIIKTNFWPFLGFVIVTGLIGMVGIVACGIGIVVTMPIPYCILAVAYRDVYGQSSTAPAAAPAVDEAPPAEEG